jgi:DnaK suppressor protein
MDENRARSLLQAERAEVQGLLAGSEQAGEEDREAEDEEGGIDSVDPATSLTAEGMDDAITDSMRDRLAAIDRALKRLDDGTYGRSVRSGAPIPDERLEADPAAELTVEEARQAERAADREQAREAEAGE